MGEPSDEDLLRQYQENSAAAFREIYLRHRVGTFNFILQLVKEKALAEDIHQEMWLGVVDSAKRWRPTGEFRSWLYQVARNRCYDHFRAKKRSIVDDDDGEVIEKADHHVPQPSDLKLREAVLHCIGELNASQRQVFCLRAVEDLTFAQITEVMASPPGLSNRRMQLAVDHLRGCLHGKGIREDA